MLIAVDTETTGLDRVHGCRPFIVTAYDEQDNEYLWRWEVDPKTRKVKYDPDDLAEISELIYGNIAVFHNILFDVGMLTSIGVLEPDYLRTQEYHDTLIASHICDNLEPHGLKRLGLKYLDILDDDETDLKKAVKSARIIAKRLGLRYAVEGEPHMPATKAGFAGADYWLPRAIALYDNYDQDHQWLTVCEKYAVNDVIRTLGLHIMYQEVMRNRDMLDIYDRRMALVPVIGDMQRQGVTIMPQKMEELLDEYTEIEQGYAEQARTIVGDPKMNIDSHDAMRVALYTTLELPISYWTKGGKPATHVDALMNAMEAPENAGDVHDFILSVLLHRKHQKAAGDLESYLKHNIHGKLYYNLNITGTQTTRFSSSYPNTQNISKGENPLQEFLENALTMRRVFGPAPGRVWFAIDYRQLQLFIFAYLSNEGTLIDALESGMDAHDFVARKVFEIPDGEEPSKGKRRIAKNVNFGFIFGASPKKIEATAGKAGLWDTVTRLFPNAHKYMQETLALVREQGFVELRDGYQLKVPRDAPYAGVNYLVQGTEGIIVQEAMLRVDDYLREHCPDAFMTLMIHDELVIDCPEDIDKQHIANISTLMADSGLEYGMKLETSCDLITDNLGNGEPWEPTAQ